MAKTPVELANTFKTQDEWLNHIKPIIAERVKQYKAKGLDEKSALAELDDEFAEKDLVRESYYGRPKRSDVQVWRDRAYKLSSDEFPIAVEELSDEQIQNLINKLGFNRNGEW